ncbi:MAG: hypothetical protein IJF71_03050, partial [Clostridia bacterium]|nr:hypothetical protein [Clostridia bacterium]
MLSNILNGALSPITGIGYLIVAVVAILFAVGGVFLGAFIARRKIEEKLGRIKEAAKKIEADAIKTAEERVAFA